MDLHLNEHKHHPENLEIVQLERKGSLLPNMKKE